MPQAALWHSSPLFVCPLPLALTSQRAIESDYAAICDVAPQLANIATLEEFQWARMCVCSRNFGCVHSTTSRHTDIMTSL